MNENATRSVNLTMLMIVSVCLPMMGAFDAPFEPELDRAAQKSETAPQPGDADCYGYDACRGVDAGNSAATAIDLTSDFSFAGEEMNTYWGSTPNVTSYSSGASSDEHNDVYSIDLPPGYGFSVEVDWNVTGASMEAYAYSIGIGSADSMTWQAWAGSGSWGRNYYSTTGDIAISSDGNDTNSGSYTYWYDETPPVDVMGDEVLAWVWCYYCYYSGVAQDYQMNITIFPADGGVKGDVETAQYSGLGSVPMYGEYSTYYTFDFELDGNSVAEVNIECDFWCNSENEVDIHLPNGTTWNDGYWPSYFVGKIAEFSEAGSYTVEIYDSWGDAGLAMTVGANLGNFSGMLTATDYIFEDEASGHVDQTDTTDVYVVWLPENYIANVTLHWENSADLDMNVYTDYDTASGLSGFFGYSWFDQPEFIDIGSLGDATAFFVEIEHYSGPASGYILELQTQPGAPPPCFFQSDAGTGADSSDGDYSPDDEPTDIGGYLGVDGHGMFTGTACAGYDTSDWYQLTVPAYHGMHATLEWPEGVDSNFNDTISVEGDLQFSQYFLSDTGYQYSASSSYGFHPQAVATNESYYYDMYLDQDSVVYLWVNVVEMTEDYESNYTIKFSIYNATEEPYQSIYQNDAGNYSDAGDSYADAMPLMSMNQTFTAYGHDRFDQGDYYKIFVPNNYGMKVSVSFPAQNDIDIGLYYMHPTYGYYYFIDSSYYDNPEEVYSMYDQGGQDIYLMVNTDRGSGQYEVDIGLLTPGMAPGDVQDDCGTGQDMTGPYFYAPGDGWHWANWSDQADLQPWTDIDGDGEITDADVGATSGGVARDSWEGGSCTGWIDGTWDWQDTYSIPVPNGMYAEINVTFPADGSYWGIYILFCPNQHDPCGVGTNYMYYAGAQYYSNDGESISDNGLWPAGSNDINGNPGWISMWIYSFGASNATYTMTTTFMNQSDLPGIHNDANSGRDAGPTEFSFVHANDYMNASQSALYAANNTLEFNGWNHGDFDNTDRFTFDVPANHGVDITVTGGFDAPDVWIIMDIFDSSWTQIGMSAWLVGYQNYNTTSVASGFDSWMGLGVRNWGSYDDVGWNYTVTVQFYSLDADGDGWWDQLEWDCGTDPYDNQSVPQDTDGDGICDFLDEDIDGDGIGNDLDEMPLDENGSSDMDGDGIDDATDPDIDGDGWDNIVELICAGAGSFADMDANITPSDYDEDGLCDQGRMLVSVDGGSTWSITATTSDTEHQLASLYLDADGDNDGTGDLNDAFDFDECADTDTDHDGMPNDIDTGLLDANNDTVCVPETPTNLTADDDDDGDGFTDDYEVSCGSDPLESGDKPVDSTLPDGDGVCDLLDEDDDNDGVNDTEDFAPLDPTEQYDADGDGQGDRRDMDDDNDGWWDSCDLQDWLYAQNASIVEGVNYFTGQPNGVATTCPAMVDAFPMDGTEWIDTDGDGVGNNADTNDDGDTDANNDPWTDAEEIACGSDPLDSSSTPADFDEDGICDVTDTDDDGDGTPDDLDSFPTNANELADLDGDGTGDDAEHDDDGDGWADLVEPNCGSDPLDGFSVPTDNDGDGECDLVDSDDDNDGTPDDTDVFPMNPNENADLDGDGTGDNADTDDDGDGWLDVTEVVCANRGGQGDPRNADEVPADTDWVPGPDGEMGTADDVQQGDGLCNALDPDDDGDGYPDPQNPNNPGDDEDRFPNDHTEWFDANNDGQGDNEAPITLIDKVEGEPAPYLGIVAVIAGLGYGLVTMSRNASSGSGSEDDAADYTEDFEDFDFEDEEPETEEEADDEEED